MKKALLIVGIALAVGLQSTANAQVSATYDEACIGIDCDSIFPLTNAAEMKFQANNIRIWFEDSSTDPGFPTNDWILGANELSFNGANMFYIQDLTGSTIPFKVFAGAPTDALTVSSSDVAVNAGTTAKLRLNATSTSSAWNIEGTQYIFSIKDITNGGTPFSIVNLPGIVEDINLNLRTTINATSRFRDNVEMDSSLVVQANACIGLDCTTNEQYPGFRRRLRIKGENAALEFIDASFTTGFPTHDWSILVNESAFNGDDQIAFEDMTAGTIPFIVKSAPDNSFIVQQSGSVSIGDTLENGKLYVNGNVNVNGDVTLLSDRRVKEDIAPLGYGLSEVMKLSPRQFVYKPFVGNNAGKVQFGLIAQEVEQTIPEVVSDGYTIAGPDGTANEYKGVDYIELVPVLINAIQEQQEVIKRLEERVAELERD